MFMLSVSIKHNRHAIIVWTIWTINFKIGSIMKLDEIRGEG